MTDEQKLYELLKDFDPAVGERMEPSVYTLPWRTPKQSSAEAGR